MEEALASLPEITDQHRFNCQRWESLQGDHFLASLDHRIETDAFGDIVMLPPPGFSHSSRQANAMFLLKTHLPSGRVQPECPVSTLGGVKGVDVIWISEERLREAKTGEVLTKAPEICLEIASPSNTRQGLEEKKRLYFEMSAKEVWICNLEGRVSFYLSSAPEIPATASLLCPAFPAELAD